ncbi:hypothetical protein Y032_0009g736 [Ancylostoma ceylanicum]|uniref:Uncharacterized protein n=1 Tax=Ancylostoma ceylanicum TaxID=53326 RepID=A0A016VL04_9BILA|nr:hypothetical protein Y032_0009g736 [Ancylostoma ceylanicum]
MPSNHSELSTFDQLEAGSRLVSYKTEIRSYSLLAQNVHQSDPSRGLPGGKLGFVKGSKSKEGFVLGSWANVEVEKGHAGLARGLLVL